MAFGGSILKLGYGTYGMHGLDVFEAVPRLRDIGYEAVEICVRDGLGDRGRRIRRLSPTEARRVSP